MSDFARIARRALRDGGYSMRAAARALNYDPAYLSRVLNGKQRPSPQLVEALDGLVGADGALRAVVMDEEGESRVAGALTRPAGVDGRTVEALAGVLRAQRRLEDAIGPTPLIPAVRAQLEQVGTLAREARGPHRRALLAVAAEWHQYAGWLHAAVRRDARALELLSAAEELSDEAGDGTVAAVAVSFRGYVARQRGNFRGVLRASHAALHAPGAHPTQRVFDTLQAAGGHAGLGEREKARRLLGEAAEASTRVSDPPSIVYWYSPQFFQMNIGMVSLSLDDHAAAADLLSEGLRGLPAEQRGAEWTTEYRTALARAERAR
ncbi:helix-turn-helix domain-containing protein [Streptomyces alkaliphilus]|uniref:helix-turn-helix domain-containing protein n=1 Tax=Streptomyces alkaliphilus TaxID=1472722 RepID=UPI00117DBDBA|nr:helix-turn-helix transcriptional regulator [Streptomyces alkaliphilus]MQS08047.1 helix-turn-helix domain-containing protein [Streptomyces alkaliphilus]